MRARRSCIERELSYGDQLLTGNAWPYTTFASDEANQYPSLANGANGHCGLKCKKLPPEIQKAVIQNILVHEYALYERDKLSRDYWSPI